MLPDGFFNGLSVELATCKSKFRVNYPCNKIQGGLIATRAAEEEKDLFAGVILRICCSFGCK